MNESLSFLSKIAQKQTYKKTKKPEKVNRSLKWCVYNATRIVVFFSHDVAFQNSFAKVLIFMNKHK